MKLKPFNQGPVTLRSMPFWCVGNPLSDPFGEKILPPVDSLQVAEILAEAAGEGLIEATSFHDDDLVPWNPEAPRDDLDPASATHKKLVQIRDLLRKAGLTVNTATCSLHGSKIFRNGGLTNPDPKIRAIARLKVERTLRIGHFFGARYFTYWVARDGFEVPVTVDWNRVYTWLAEGLDHAVDYMRAHRLTHYQGATIEPKPNEPRGHMYLPTSGHAVGFICGRLKRPDFWGVNPELLQHESMALMNGVHTLGYLISLNKLSFLHFGSQIKAQFDNDFPPLVGPEGLKETAQMFWLLRQTGWKGVVEFDCHMMRTEGDPADGITCRKLFIRNCSRAVSIALALSDRLARVSLRGLGETEADHRSIQAMCGLDPRAMEAHARKR
ncbi:MAG: Xylose isomerase [candidate division BRC1 bacterium ADurb.BinA292]|nr:MAG: Xylose isomerase [candidate division BRC1 bacterium ADurb.BinA292]